MDPEKSEVAQWDEVEIQAVRPWVPPGKYRVACVGIDPPWSFKGRKYKEGHVKAGEPAMKITIWFSVTETGEHMGVRLPLMMNYSRRPGRGSKLWQYIVLCNGSPPKRAERVSLRKLFLERGFMAVVRDVAPESDEHPLYSVIDRLIEPIAGAPRR